MFFFSVPILNDLPLGVFHVVLTWSYAETSNYPNNTGYTDVAHEGQLCLKYNKKTTTEVIKHTV